MLGNCSVPVCNLYDAKNNHEAAQKRKHKVLVCTVTTQWSSHDSNQVVNAYG
jgi:hypothetical protein